MARLLACPSRFVQCHASLLHMGSFRDARLRKRARARSLALPVSPLTTYHIHTHSSQRIYRSIFLHFFGLLGAPLLSHRVVFVPFYLTISWRDHRSMRSKMEYILGEICCLIRPAITCELRKLFCYRGGNQAGRFLRSKKCATR